MKLSTVAIIGLVAAVRGMVPGSGHISARELFPDCLGVSERAVLGKSPAASGALHQANDKALNWAANLTSKAHPEHGYVLVWGAWKEGPTAPGTVKPAEAVLINHFSHDVYVDFPLYDNKITSYKSEKGKTCRVRKVDLSSSAVIGAWGT